MTSRNSKTKQKALDYHKKTKEIDKTFKQLQLSRPQDVNKELLLRARQLNFQMVNCDENVNQEKILKWEPNEEMLIPKMKWKCFQSGKPEPQWISTESQFQEMMIKLKTCSEFTIDVEGHSHRSQKGFISLIQIGTWTFGDFLIDPFTLRNCIISELKLILESPDVLKIGHDLTNDVKWFQRDFDIFIVAAIDTQIMYRLLTGENNVGFKKLALQMYPELEKLFVNETLSDWRLRPGKGMTKEQEIYATNDVHVLLRVFDQIRFEIKEADPSGRTMYIAFEETKSKLLQVSEDIRPNDSRVNFSTIAQSELNRLKNDKRRLSKMATRINRMTETEIQIFVGLVEWRDVIAKIIDEKPTLLVSSETLVGLATLETPEIKDILQVLGEVDRRIIDPNSDKALQAAIIKKIILSCGDYVQELRRIECHNCLKTGHGPAWACPFPKQPENYKAWMNRPENQATKVKQNQRRLSNLSAKVGEEKARKLLSGKK